ncbi:DUF2231 domain-containing protein [Aureimonas sp. SK2]|uniref:DUF2231 domain-containing protein n=1 Tax=Aureimonas sp. SK2 TaxID=3015992 RepID=UPI00244477D3|nr:DUF2231 domain-containing protein [Aureimonas sp. SK2]
MSSTSEAPGSFSEGLHGILLSFPVALFATALACDLAYLGTAEIQWTNFASWSIAGALVFGGLVLLWALVDWLRQLRRPGGGRRFTYLVVVAVLWGVGLVNAFHHVRDGWSSVGLTGLLLSIASTVLALAAGWMIFSRNGRPEIAR